jgi:hypothetical protein
LRRRLGVLVIFAVVLAVASPSLGATSRTRVGCGAHIRSGQKASCARSFRIPHFNGRDSFDLDRLMARVVSPEASSWRVSGAISDARGVVYFQWYCSAQSSSVTRAWGTYAGRSCEAWRKTVRVRRNGRTYLQYYVADTSKAQRLVVSAVVGSCAPTGVRGCTFEARATYKLSS